MTTKTDRKETVFIVDDDRSVLTSTSRFLRSHGYRTKSYESAAQFLDKHPKNEPGCILLDINMPCTNGMELLDILSERKSCHPIIFLTSHADLETGISAMKKGASNFLCKATSEEKLLHAIDEALGQCGEQLAASQQYQKYKTLASKLTEREREICAYVVSGLLNKQIAYELNIAERTVKAHRASIMTKLGLSSVAELVRVSQVIGIRPALKRHSN